MRKDSKIYLFILFALLTALIIAGFVVQEFNKLQISPLDNNLDNKSNNKSITTKPEVVYVEMPDGEKLIAEVHYKDNWSELILKFQNGKTIGSEKEHGSNLSDEEIRKRAIELVHFLKRENRNQAMSRIIFWGMDNGFPNNESTKAANEFGECIDAGKNPDECVQELKAKHEWLTKINFSDLILLYKRW